MKYDPASWTPESTEFRAFYGWTDADGTWSLGRTTTAAGSVVAYHVFRGPTGEPAKGTVFVLHGYLEHSALRVPVIREATAAGWDVVGIDLPGHGLSSGVRADIDSFYRYAETLEAVMAARNWTRPLRAIAHSTGCSTVMLVCERGGNPFDLCVFEAPLIRTVLWEPTLIGERLLSGAVSTVPRYDGGVSKDQPFYKRLKSDPLYVGKVPLHWFDSVRRYVDATKEWQPIPGRFLILQGTKDTVVDSAYNIPFLRTILPGGDFRSIQGGKHPLLMDEGPAGEEARRIIRNEWQAGEDR